MCLECHEKLSDDIVIQSLQSLTCTPKEFERFNTTSIHHLYLSAIGFNGPVARDLALQVLDKYIQWRDTQPNDYMPTQGMEAMYTSAELDDMLTFLHHVHFSHDATIHDRLERLDKQMAKVRSKYPPLKQFTLNQMRQSSHLNMPSSCEPTWSDWLPYLAVPTVIACAAIGWFQIKS